MNHPATQTQARQVAATCHALVAQSELPFAEHLPPTQVHDTWHRLGGFFRQRVFTPAVTLWTFLSQILAPDHSCQQAVDRVLAHRAALGLPDCSDDTGAYGRARARLPEELLHQLLRQTGQQSVDQVPEAGPWPGRRLKVVDGTGLSMPDTPKNQKEYPQSEEIPAGIGFPLMRMVVVFCLSPGTVLDAALGQFHGEGHGELSLFRTLIRQLLGRSPGLVARGRRGDAVEFHGALHAIHTFLPKLQAARSEAEVSRLWQRLLALIGRRRVENRPDRYEPRKVKRRPKNVPRLTVPRAEERRRLRDGVSEEITTP